MYLKVRMNEETIYPNLQIKHLQYIKTALK